MGPIIARKMTIEDIDAVVKIEEDCFTMPWSKNSFLMEIKENLLAIYCVAEMEGQVLGYGGIWLIVGEGHITNVAVHSKHRGQGAGKIIIEELISQCKIMGIKKMTLEVRRSNLVAQNLYKQYGFILSGVRPEYYQDDKEDALIMWKDID